MKYRLLIIGGIVLLLVIVIVGKSARTSTCPVPRHYAFAALKSERELY